MITLNQRIESGFYGDSKHVGLYSEFEVKHPKLLEHKKVCIIIEKEGKQLKKATIPIRIRSQI